MEQVKVCLLLGIEVYCQYLARITPSSGPAKSGSAMLQQLVRCVLRRISVARAGDSFGEG